MGSSHFGEPKLGNNQRSGGGSTTSRKNKKSNSISDKPKQPQRGLGVAQLEKIRLHGEISSSHLPPFQNPYVPNLSQENMRIQTPYSSSSSSSSSSSFSYSPQSSSPYGFHVNPSIVMGMSDIERANIGYANSQFGPKRWSSSNAIFDTQQRSDQSGMTRQLFNLQVEDSSIERRNDEDESSSGKQEEVDLELRLSFKSQ